MTGEKEGGKNVKFMGKRSNKISEDKANEFDDDMSRLNGLLDATASGDLFEALNHSICLGARHYSVQHLQRVHFCTNSMHELYLQQEFMDLFLEEAERRKRRWEKM